MAIEDIQDHSTTLRKAETSPLEVYDDRLVVRSWYNPSQLLEPRRDYYSGEVLPTNRQNTRKTASVDQQRRVNSSLRQCRTLQKLNELDCKILTLTRHFAQQTTTISSNIWITFFRRNVPRSKRTPKTPSRFHTYQNFFLRYRYKQFVLPNLPNFNLIIYYWLQGLSSLVQIINEVSKTVKVLHGGWKFVYSFTPYSKESVNCQKWLCKYISN